MKPSAGRSIALLTFALSLSPARALAAGALPHLRLTPLALAQAGQQMDNGLDFDLLGDAKPAKASAAQLALEAQAHARRSMLTFHQGIGLGTLGMLALTDVVGQLNYMDRFAAGASNTARWERTHEVLALATLAGFATTGALGLLAPVPYPKPRDFDTTAVHKLCMAGATLGMAAELGLGLFTVGHEGFADQRTLAQVHQVIGYTTLGFMTVGAGAFLF